jgi:spermidine synthase
LFAHPNPRKVLIIGGGDGGSVREALKHSTIEKIVLVEIDDEVINASKIFFPTLSAMLDHPKVRVKVGDGVEFLRKCALRSNGLEAGYSTVDVMDPDVPEDGRFDVIITDNSNMDDLGSINEALFGKDYFKNIHDVLRPPHGIMSSLAGGHWLFLNFHRQLDILCHKLFPTCRFATFNVPTWTGGTEGLLLATIDPQADLEYPNQQRMSELNTMKLRLYNRRIHNAIFALPQFLLETLKNNSEKQKKSDKEL